MIAIVAIPLLLWCICLVLGITFRNLSGKPSDRHLFVTGLIVFICVLLSVCHPVYAVGMEYRYLLLALTVFLRHLLLFCCSGHSEVSQKKQKTDYRTVTDLHS